MSSNTTDAARDQGISLVEVVMYAGLSAMMLLVVAAVFTSGWQAARATTGRDAATGTALVITGSIQGSIRNATEDFTAGSNHLIAKVAKETCGWEYRAWWLDGADLLYRVGASAAPTIPPSGARTGWVVLASGVSILPGETNAFEKKATAGQVRLQLNLRAQSGDTVVPIRAAYAAQAKGTPPC